MSSAAVSVDGEIVGKVDRGLLALVGIERDDSEETVEQAAAKVSTLRLFEGSDGRTGLAIADVGAAVLVVSQFTLAADTRRGRRPSFAHAARPEVAAPLVDRFAAALRATGIDVATGRFGAAMRIDARLDGPFTLVLDFGSTQRDDRTGLLLSGATTPDPQDSEGGS